jgi:hypothetical protein
VLKIDPLCLDLTFWISEGGIDDYYALSPIGIVVDQRNPAAPTAMMRAGGPSHVAGE